MSKFHPTVSLNGITEITLELLSTLGVKGLIVDIDNTLTTHNNPAISQEIAAWVQHMKDSEVPMVIMSNNYEDRVKDFAEIIALPYVYMAKKPLASGFARAEEILQKEGITKSEIAIVGDQLFTDIYGGNRYGITTIHVMPILPEEGWSFRLRRWLEHRILKRYHAKRRKKGEAHAKKGSGR